MSQKLDYSREDAMKILNNENYSDEEKRGLYEEYMSKLKKNRKNEIVNRLNNYAKDIPVITKEIYISKLKEYENDDLSKPFEVIEKELSIFEIDMKKKYQEYLDTQNKVVEEEIVPDVSHLDEDDFSDTIFSDPINITKEEVEEDDEEEVKPSLLITDEISVLNEEPDEEMAPLFDNSDDDGNEILPDDINDNEKGNASAIILSIIAVIIGIVVMYSIIKLN